MAGIQGVPVKGQFDLNSGLSNFRTYGIDKASVSRRIRGEMPFYTLLMMKTKKTIVDTYAFDHVEQPEEAAKLTLSGAGANVGGTMATANVPNAEAKLLQEGQLLTNFSILWDISSGYSKPATITSNYNPELAKIVSIGAPGATHTTITIQRNHAYKGSGSNTNSDTVLWAAGDRVFRGNFARYDSEGTGKPILVNPYILRSYVQDFYKPFGLTEREREEAKWVNKDPLTNAKENAMWNFAYDIERALLVSGQGFETATSGGYNVTNTHSMISIIGQNQGTNWKQITDKTPSALAKALAVMSEKGRRSDVRVLACTGEFIRTVTGMFQSFIKDEPLNGAKNAGFTVPTYTDPTQVKYQLMYSRALNDTYGANGEACAIGINMENVELAVFKGKSGKSYDLHVDMGPNGKGKQSNNSNSILGEYRLVAGLKAKDYETHAFFYF